MSSAQKVPTISVSSTRKATKYSTTRSLMELQLARMQIGIRKVVSSTSSTLIPSTPIR